MARNDAIIRPCLGRTARIGDLYDVRRDAFVGINIFKKLIPNESLYTTSNHSQNSEFVMTSKISDKLKSLKLDGDVTLSCLCGLFPVSGSASYLNEKKNSKKAVQCSFVQKIRTVDERINVKDDAIWDCYSTETGNEGTHVVIGISWGANATVTLTYENNEDRSKDEIEHKLKVNLEKLEKLKITSAVDKIGGGGKWLDENKFTAQEMHLKVHADVLSNDEGTPRSLEEAMELIYNMPRRVAETVDGKGKQLELHLLPLSMLKKHLSIQLDVNELLYEIEGHTVKRIEQLFDGIEESREALNDLCTYLDKNALYVSSQDKNRARKYQAEFEVAVSKFRHDLARMIKDVRSCRVEPSKLDSLRSDFEENSPASADKVTEFIASCDLVMEKITLLNSFTSDGAQFISKISELNTAKYNYHDRQLNIFYFSFQNDRQSLQWGDSISLFRSLCKACSITNEICFAVDTDYLLEVIKSESLSPGLKICRMLNGNYICKDVLEEHQKSSALDAVNSNSNTNNKEKKMVVKLFDVALDRTLTIVDFTLKTSQYVVATNFVIENYTNEKLVYVKMNVIHGEVPTDPRDIEPGEKLQFSSHKRSFATYGFCAIAIWQYKDRFIVVICQVPLTAVGGVNTLSIGITKPGVKYTNLTVPSDKSFEAHYKSIKTGLSSSDSHYKAFQDCGYSDSIQDISVEDRDITITGRMGTLKNCVVEIEIIPHREDDFAPQLIKHARDYANK